MAEVVSSINTWIWRNRTLVPANCPGGGLKGSRRRPAGSGRDWPAAAGALGSRGFLARPALRAGMKPQRPCLYLSSTGRPAISRVRDAPLRQWHQAGDRRADRSQHDHYEAVAGNTGHPLAPLNSHKLSTTRLHSSHHMGRTPWGCGGKFRAARPRRCAVRRAVTI